MTDIYNNETYLDNNPTWHEEDSSWKAGHIHTTLKRNNISPGTICEIGCGAGEILNQLHAKSAAETRFYGYEISEIAHKICQTKAKDRLQFYLADLLAEEGFFDVLLAIDVFEHVEDYFGFLRQVKSKATYKIFHIPLELSAQSVLRSSPLLSSRDRLGHLHFFSKDIALDSLRRTGYEIVDYKFTNAAFDLPKKMRTKLLNTPRWMLYKISPDLCSRIFGGFSLIVLAK